jgi:hypothetical protein
MQHELKRLRYWLRQIRNFSVAAVPGTFDIKTLDTATARSSEIYTQYINMLDQQIMFSLFGSQNLRMASGSELATGRVVENMWIRFAQWARRKYARDLAWFFSKGICALEGIRVKPREFTVQYSPIVMEKVSDMTSAITAASDGIMFTGPEEERRAWKSVFEWIDDVSPTMAEQAKTYAKFKKELEVKGLPGNPAQPG